MEGAMAIDQSLKRKRGRPVGSHSQSAERKMAQKTALVEQRLALLDTSISESDKNDDYMPMSLLGIKKKMEQKMALDKQRLPLLDNSSSISKSDKDDDYMPISLLGIKKKMEQKMALDKLRLPLLDNSSSRSKSDKDDDYMPVVSDVSRQKISASFHSNCGSAMARAKEIQAKLPAQHPSFIKEMLKSHVVLGFWLGLPRNFCNKHLPMSNTLIVLEDENGVNHDTSYLAEKQGLSAGWRGFAIKHFLKVGDVVVFELIMGLGSKTEAPPKFKLYIVRANELTRADGAVSPVALDVRKEAKLSSESEEESAGYSESEEDPEVYRVPLIDANGIVRARIDGHGMVSEAIDGIRMVDSDIDFEDVTSFSKFSIVVDGLFIDCEFQEHLRRMYYELCYSQKAFLHKHLLKQLNLKLVVGVIMETVNIAEGIRACKADEASCREDLLIWKRTLESFELLGMDVVFLVKRVDALLSLQQTWSRNVSEWREKKYEELSLESGRAAEKVKALELQLSGVKDVLLQVDADVQEMESSVRKSDVALRELANAPW